VAVDDAEGDGSSIRVAMITDAMLNMGDVEGYGVRQNFCSC